MTAPASRKAKRRPGALISLLKVKGDERTPIFLRLYRQLRAAIVQGHLKEGARLPGTRSLAHELGVARVSVESAYGRLEQEGLVRRRSGSGTFVSFGAPSASSPGRLKPQLAALRLSRRGAAIFAGGGCLDHPGVRPFGAGRPDLRAFPTALWNKTLSAAAKGDAVDLLDYGSRAGLARLREAVAAYLVTYRGVQCVADQVLILTSSQQALDLAARVLLDPGDVVAVEDPGYRGAATAFAAAGANLHSIDVDADGMVVGGLAASPSAPRLVYVTPSHQFPLGSTLSRQRRTALLAWADAADAYVIEDDYDGDFRYHGDAVPALQGMDRQGRVLYVGTFSKTMFPSIRLAYLVLPPPLVEPFTVARSVVDGHTSQLFQAAMASFMIDGHFAAHMRNMRSLYSARLAVLQEEVSARLRGYVTLLDASCGLQAAALVDEPQRFETVHAGATAAGLHLPRLDELYLRRPLGLQNGWILGFAALAPTEIRAGVHALRSAFQ
ncbi:MAG: PLP-dependent aminotransferase family protein [Ramlibacter sp.]|nr:PLP-dependent aminotransferase family protein [Ramlibacter sp.]